MKKRIISVLTVLSLGAITLANNYYQDKQSNAAPTKTVNGNNQLAYNKKANNEYRQALRLLWGKVYSGKGETLYCQYHFNNKKKSARQNNINAEHVFPMSWVTNDLKCGSRKQCQNNNADFRGIESDLHNIYPSNTKINKARSNFRFGEISGEKREFGQCDFEINRKSRIAEPRQAIQGELARAMLYMEYQYNLSLRTKMKRQLQRWDKLNPPNAEEKRRQQLIKSLQGRENPFISRHPFKPKP